MKKLFYIVLLLGSTYVFSQNKGITYQAVIYAPGGQNVPGVNVANVPMANRTICLQFSFLDASSGIEYQEEVKTKTDEFGMVNITIGSGTQTGGYASSFATIVWTAAAEKSLKVSLDATGLCNQFDELSTEKLEAVPFANAAITAGNVSGVVAIANGGTGATTAAGARTNLGIGNVENTTDLNKPMSTATKTYIDGQLTSSTIVDADANTKGKLQLAGDLSGTAAAPTVPGLILKENVANKSTNTTLGTSNILFPTQNAVKTYVDTAIAGATIVDADAFTKGKLQLAGDLAGTAAAPTVPGLALKLDASLAGVPNGLATLNSAGIIPANQLPPISVASTNVVANQTEMLALSAATVGSIAVRTDVNKNFILSVAGPSVLSNWIELLTPGAPVQSVNGLTGAIQLAKSDINLANVDNTSDLAKPISTATQNTLNLKLNANQVGVPNGTASLNALGKIPTDQIPSISFSSVKVLGSQSEMLALSNAVVGSVVIRTDVNKNFVLAQSDPTILANWVELLTPAPPVQSVNGYVGNVSLTKSDVGLANVDNTGDINKPVSTATQTALDLKANLASPTFTGTIGGITKSMVGLANVDNTTDLNKPVSTPTQNALDLKANLASPTFSGTVSGITKAMVGLADVDNTTDAAKPVSTATQTALDLKSNVADVTSSLALKANLASPTFTGTVSGIDKTMVGLGNVDNTTDAAKPVSTATQTALDLKANAADLTTALALKENSSNKSITTTLGTSDVLFPTQNAVKTYVDTAIAGATIVDADATTKGKLQLAGDLTGTAALPQIAASAVTSTKILDGTIATADLANTSVTDAKINTVSGSKVTGDITGNAANVNGVVDIENGGTGSDTKNFVDLTTAQTVAGTKSFSNDTYINELRIGKGAGSANYYQNTALGYVALSSNTTGEGNTAIGYDGQKSGTTGSLNTSIGFAALIDNTTGSGNTALGYQTLQKNSGDNNIAIGMNAMYLAQNSNNNIVLGSASLEMHADGARDNIILGVNSLNGAVAPIENIVIGNVSGTVFTNETNNTLIGNQTNITAGVTNATAIGNGAIVNASNRIQLGNTAVTNVKTAGTITAGGMTYPNTTGTTNQVLTTDGTGSSTWQTFIAFNKEVSKVNFGANTGYGNQAEFTTAVGPYAGQQDQGINATALGRNAGNTGQGASAVAVGALAGAGSQGVETVAVGLRAGETGQGAKSVAIGAFAGQTNQHANSIILNATGAALNSDNTNALYIAPIRSASNTNVLLYNPTTKEVTTSVNIPGNAANVTGTVAIANGGTGATTAAAALTNLGAEASANKSTATDLGNSAPSDVLFPSQAAVKAYVDSSVSSGAPDATTTTAGKIKLAGDLTGTAALPEIATGAVNSAKILDGTIADVDIADNTITGAKLNNDLYAAGKKFTFQDLLIGAGTTFGRIATDGTKHIAFEPTHNVESTRFWGNGNITIQTGGTFTDNGYKLEVDGTTNFIGNSSITGSLTASSGITGTQLTSTVATGTAPLVVTSTTPVANLSIGGNAANVTGTVAIANGGTGSTTKNFVDLTTTQTIAGDKTFSNTIKITAGTPGAGKVLTSDANGLASWSDIPVSNLITGVTGILPLASGGTGSATQNFVDLTTDQTIAGVKIFSSDIVVNGVKIGRGTGDDGQNTAIGNSALGTGTGTRNTGVGYNALGNYTGTSFDNNTAVGYSNSNSITTGQQNTALGAEALMAATTAIGNTAIGAQTLLAATGSGNTALGYASGQIITSGTNNTFVGNGANAGIATVTNATAIGSGATVAASNTIQLGDANVTNVNTSGAITSADGITGTQLTSTVATGTAPLVVTSTTPVANLNIGGNAATVTTNANLTGDVTSSGNATTIGASKVVTGMIADGTIIVGDLADNAIETAKIKDVNVTTDKLAANAVTTAKITDANVTEAKLAADAVTSAKIKNGEIATLDIANAAITYAKIQNVAAGKVLGNFTGSAGVVEEIATTGTGDVVRATSPTLVTPALGTPSAAVLTNATGLPLTSGVTGTLPVANGGTGVTSIAANSVILGNGTSALQTVAPGTSGNILTSDGTTWQSTAPAAGAMTGTAAAGQVTYFTGTSTTAGSSKFLWDNTNSLFKVGPGYDSSNAESGFNGSGGNYTYPTNPVVGIYGDIASSTENTLLRLKRAHNQGSSYQAVADFVMSGARTKLNIRLNNAGDDDFVDALTLTNTANGTAPLVGINKTNPTTTLDVVGTAAVSGNTSVGGTLGVTGAVTLDNLTASKAVFTDSSKVLTSTGVLGLDQGGLGLSSVAAGRIPFGDSTTALNTSSKFLFDNTNSLFKVGPGYDTSNGEAGFYGSGGTYTYDSSPVLGVYGGPANATESTLLRLKRVHNQGTSYQAVADFVMSGARTKMTIRLNNEGDNDYVNALTLTNNVGGSLPLVGINKLTPTATLDVAGTAAVSGNTTVGGTLGVTGALTSSAGITGSQLTSTIATGTAPLVVTSTTPVANLSIGGNAANVTGTVAIANGGTGSTTKNFVDLTTDQTIDGVKTFSGTSTIVNQNLTVNAAGTTGQGIILSDDGDIVDNNDGAATFRFGGGIKINNGNKSAGTSTKITLANTGHITAAGTITGTQLTSTVATGTAPLVVTSTTPVANLSIGGNAATATTATHVTGGDAGSLPYQTAAATTAMLAKGTDGKVLTLASGLPSWSNSGGTIASMSATGNASSTASYIIFTGSSASQTITVPSAATVGAGKEITIKNVASVSVSIASASGNLIQDNSTLTATTAALGIEPSNNWMKLVSDGTNWYVFRALF